jgi:hypothetical protein
MKKVLETSLAKIILKRNKVGGIILPDFKTYKIGPIIQTVLEEE